MDHCRITAESEINTLLDRVLKSDCLSASLLCVEDVFQTTKFYAAKLGVMGHHHDPECHAKMYFKVTVQAQILKKEQFSWPFLLNFWTLCNQIWYCSAWLWAGGLCDNFGLLSRQGHSDGWNPPVIFWTTEPLWMKNVVYMLVYHHDLECHVKRLGSYLQGQGHSGDSKSNP